MSGLQVIEDTDPRIQYVPAKSWLYNVHAAAFGVSNGTTHYTVQSGASASLNFTGSYIGLSFFMYLDGGNFTVNLDGEDMGQFQSGVPTAPEQGPRTLFERANLTAADQHVVIVAMMTAPTPYHSRGSSSAPLLQLDSISIAQAGVAPSVSPSAVSATVSDGSANSVIRTASSQDANSQSTGLASQSSGSAPPNAGINQSAVIGAVVGGLVLLAGIVVLLLLLRRRAKKPQSEPSLNTKQYPKTSTPTQGPNSASPWHSSRATLRPFSSSGTSSSAEIPSEGRLSNGGSGTGRPGGEMRQTNQQPWVPQPFVLPVYSDGSSHPEPRREKMQYARRDLPEVAGPDTPRSGGQPTGSSVGDRNSDHLQREVALLRDEVRRLRETQATQDASASSFGGSTFDPLPEYENPPRSRTAPSDVLGTNR